tara:strand:- start:3786 stop:4013 length:228 start_codon:yes stop_codon:yes gene_type:complete
MKEFLKDILIEDKKDGKTSSKKVMGVLAGILAFAAFVVDGFHFYEIDSGMFDSMLIFSGTMLGASIVKSFSSGTK